jgi:hypothetical protein
MTASYIKVVDGSKSRWLERCESYGAAPVHSFCLQSSMFPLRRCLFFGCHQIFDRYRYSIHPSHGFLITRRHLRTFLSLTRGGDSKSVLACRSSHKATDFESPPRASLPRRPLQTWLNDRRRCLRRGGRFDCEVRRLQCAGRAEALYLGSLSSTGRGSDAGIGVGSFGKSRINGSARQFETASPALNTNGKRQRRWGSKRLYGIFVRVEAFVWSIVDSWACI